MFKICTICKHRCELPKLFKGFKVGVEVGVMHGRYSEALLKQWPGFLHLIDPWVAYPEYTDKNQEHNYNFNMAMERLKPLEERFRVWREFNSDDVADKIGMVDFTYLDGNHAFRYALEDMQIWWPRIRPGGIMAGHDLWHLEWPDVTEAVVLFANLVRRDVHIIRGNCDCPCGEGGVLSWYIKR